MAVWSAVTVLIILLVRWLADLLGSTWILTAIVVFLFILVWVFNFREALNGRKLQ